MPRRGKIAALCAPNTQVIGLFLPQIVWSKSLGFPLKPLSSQILNSCSLSFSECCFWGCDAWVIKVFKWPLSLQKSVEAVLGTHDMMPTTTIPKLIFLLSWFGHSKLTATFCSSSLYVLVSELWNRENHHFLSVGISWGYKFINICKVFIYFSEAPMKSPWGN